MFRPYWLIHVWTFRKDTHNCMWTHGRVRRYCFVIYLQWSKCANLRQNSIATYKPSSNSTFPDSSKLSKRWPLTLFLWADTENGKKRIFSISANYLRCCNSYTGYYHAKPLVLTTLKMSWFAINSILSGLNREEKEYFGKNTQLPLVAKGRSHSWWEAPKTWQRHLTEPVSVRQLHNYRRL